MEFDDLLITTGVDALVKLIKQRGRIELNDCATALNIQQDTLEEWARVLEEEGIIKVEYKLTKIFLVWIQPTGEEIKEEKEVLEAERLKTLKELEKIKNEIPQEIGKMNELRESFNEVYLKFSEDMKRIEGKISPLISIKEALETKKIEKEKKLDAMEGSISAINADMEKILKELEKAQEMVEKNKSEESFTKIKKTQDEIHGMMSELKELRRSMEAQSSVKAELPSAYELKKKFDSIVKDFIELKNRNAMLREDLINLKEGREIVSNVGNALKEYENTTAALQKELSELTKDADSLFERVKTVDEKVRESFDTINRFSDSLNVAKGIVARFPNQEKLHSEQENILKKENEIEQKINMLKKIVEMAGGSQISMQEARELAERLDEKISELKEESLRLSESLEEEKNRYFAFQQIRERILPTLKSYQNDIFKLKTELENVRKAAATEEEELEKQLKKIEVKIGKEETSELLKLSGHINEKKKLLEQISEGFDELSERADNLNKRLSLITNQAKILSIKAAPIEEKLGKEAATAKREEEKPEHIQRQLQLTKDEEREFARKREELKKLIEKLWEDEKPKKK